MVCTSVASHASTWKDMIHKVEFYRRPQQIFVTQLASQRHKHCFVHLCLRMIPDGFQWNYQTQDIQIYTRKILECVHQIIANGIDKHCECDERDDVDEKLPVVAEKVDGAHRYPLYRSSGASDV
jgi:hypothetical protein